jgi:Ca2+-binding EF-hand superfamily protein
LAKTKKEKLEQIFECLDSDKDFRISQDKIETIGLPFEVIEILDPIFEELTQLDEGISQAEFIDAATRLYEVSTI